MGDYVANQVIKLMLKKGIQVLGSNILILGFTFKENCPDVRNTKVFDIVQSLREYNLNITIYDPWANAAAAKREYGIDIEGKIDNQQFDAAVLAVAHDEFKTLDIEKFLKKNHIIFDVKCVLPKEMVDGRL
jgi:UDP-N-acetyl-D-galactosamine dehydrogenase